MSSFAGLKKKVRIEPDLASSPSVILATGMRMTPYLTLFELDGFSHQASIFAMLANSPETGTFVANEGSVSKSCCFEA